MNLSRHFTLAELTFSRTATAEGIDNTPAGAERANLEALCTSVLDPLRDAAGGAIKVTSGYRGPVLNARVRGERKSQHLEGKAADIQPTTMSVLELFKAVVRAALPFDQLIYENKSATSKWVHISHDTGTPRGQILIAHFLPTGKVERYEPVTAQQVLEMQEAVSRSAQRLDQLEYDEMDDEPRDEDEPRGELSSRAPVAVRPAKPARTAGKKVTAKKPAAKKAPTRGPAAKKSPAKKAAPKKVALKKVAAPKKSAAKKPTAKTVRPASRRTSKPAAKKRSSRA